MINKDCTKFSGIVHYVEGNTVIASKGTNIYVSYDGGDHWNFFFKISLPISLRVRTLSKPSRRLFRARVHHLTCPGQHILALMAFGSIYTYDLEKKELSSEITPVCGRRPLTLCSADASHLYYGEYRANQERSPVHIYGSEDGGRHWLPVFRFTEVRHVHGVFHDPYDNTLWVTTGDRDRESGIWVTGDKFKTLEKIVGDSQQMRAVQLLFTEKHIYFGSDTPLEENHIYRMNKKTRKIEELQKVESSVFWGCKVGDALFFSTAVEPSKVNTCRDACIWGSKDGQNWKCVARSRKDIWPMKLFQYGQILFPSGENTSGYLWFTPFATEKDQTLRKLEIETLF